MLSTKLEKPLTHLSQPFIHGWYLLAWAGKQDANSGTKEGVQVLLKMNLEQQ